jgi:hypothetical protein
VDVLHARRLSEANVKELGPHGFERGGGGRVVGGLERVPELLDRVGGGRNDVLNTFSKRTRDEGHEVFLAHVPHLAEGVFGICSIGNAGGEEGRDRRCGRPGLKPRQEGQDRGQRT